MKGYELTRVEGKLTPTPLLYYYYLGSIVSGSIVTLALVLAP